MAIPHNLSEDAIIEDLEAEVERLRGAIAEHRDQVTSWNIANREPAPADKRLWAVLDPVRDTQ